MIGVWVSAVYALGSVFRTCSAARYESQKMFSPPNVEFWIACSNCNPGVTRSRASPCAMAKRVGVGNVGCFFLLVLDVE